MTARRRTLTAGLAAAATLGLLTIGAAPASAAVPEGDSLYGIGCPYYSADDALFPALQLFELDSDTAEGTLVGTGTPGLSQFDCALQGAWNPVTQTAYAVAQDVNTGTSLVTIDLTTGLSTLVGALTPGVDAIAISLDGVGYAIGSNTLYSLNLSTAQLTPIAGTIGAAGLATDPSTGLLYALQSGGNLYSIDPTDGSSGLLGNVGQGGTYSFTIDSAGVVWFGNDTPLGGGDYETGLFSIAIEDVPGAGVPSGEITVGEVSPYVEGLFLTWPAPPALAATGSTVASVAPIALTGAAALLLAGVVVVTVRRTRRA